MEYLETGSRIVACFLSALLILGATAFAHGLWRYLVDRWRATAPGEGSTADEPSATVRARAPLESAVVHQALMVLEAEFQQTRVLYIPALVRSGRFGDAQTALRVLGHISRIRGFKRREFPAWAVPLADRQFCLAGDEKGTLCSSLTDASDDTLEEPAPELARRVA